MNRLLLIGLGSGIGGILRYLLSTGTYKLFGYAFPFGTLVVNTLGCFLAGLVFIVLLERFDGLADPLRLLLIIGFLGGFTTFSSFSIETFNLIEKGEVTLALVNIFASVILCLALTWIGVFLGRHG